MPSPTISLLIACLEVSGAILFFISFSMKLLQAETENAPEITPKSLAPHLELPVALCTYT